MCAVASALGGPASENGRLRQGTDGHPQGDRQGALRPAGRPPRQGANVGYAKGLMLATLPTAFSAHGCKGIYRLTAESGPD